MEKIGIRSIKNIGSRQVYDLSVQGNHNFFIGKTKILTHNCDYLTGNAQAILRNLMEMFSINTRFILTANYKERIIDPIVSRTQSFHLIPPSRKEVAQHVIGILNKESVTFKNTDLAMLVNAFYPDIRKIINHCELQTKNGVLRIEERKLAESDYKTKIINILSSKSTSKEKFKEIRQTVADARISDFTDLYALLFAKVDDFAPNHISAVILAIAEGAYRDASIVDKEIGAMSVIINILELMK